MRDCVSATLSHRLLWRSTLSSNLSLKLTSKFNWEASLYDDVNGHYPGGRLDQDYFQREAYASGVLLWMPADRLALNYAADFAYGNLSSNLPQEVGRSRYTILQSLTGRYRTGRLTATASLLGSIYINKVHNGDEARDNYKLSPSASISFQPLASREWRLRASFKSIFRVPTFNESYFFTTAALICVRKRRVSSTSGQLSTYLHRCGSHG